MKGRAIYMFINTKNISNELKNKSREEIAAEVEKQLQSFFSEEDKKAEMSKKKATLRSNVVSAFENYLENISCTTGQKKKYISDLVVLLNAADEGANINFTSLYSKNTVHETDEELADWLLSVFK